MLTDINIQMKSYNEAHACAKSSLTYAISRTGLKILRTVISSGITKITDKRRSTFNFRPSKMLNTEELAKATINHQTTVLFEALLKEIDELLVSMDHWANIEEDVNIPNTTTNNINNGIATGTEINAGGTGVVGAGGGGNRPSVQRAKSIANTKFLKQVSTVASLRGGGSMKIEQFKPSDCTTENEDTATTNGIHCDCNNNCVIS